jgi:surface antigen
MPRLLLALLTLLPVLGLGACGTTRDYDGGFASPHVIGGHTQCVPFVREETGIAIKGDAVTWWAQAAGRYERTDLPEEGSILVLRGYKRADRGHVAVVRRIVSDREIVIDHANWLNDGQIYLDQPVLDVSADNDWSAVKVWYAPGNQYGARTYTVQGFILPDVRVADVR